MFLGIFLAALGISGAKCAIENSQIKRDSRTVDEKGNVHYYDRQLRSYINGERVERVETQDKDGVTLYSTVGVNSHKVYETRYGRNEQIMFEMSEEDKQYRIKKGYLAYSQYNPYFRKRVTTEISTGRTITCLFSGKNQKTGKQIYKKWYYRPECQNKYQYDTTVDGDFGIDITEEEYRKLNVLGSHSKVPSDGDVLFKLWGWGYKNE